MAPKRAMSRCFNTVHANRADLHYTVPALGRLPPDTINLVHQGHYFVLHGPRQSGKTTCIHALAQALRETGRYVVAFGSAESADGVRDPVEAQLQICDSLAAFASWQVAAGDRPEPATSFANEIRPLHAYLTRWAERVSRPLVVFLDEIDTLVDEALVAVLRLLRDGYSQRPGHFPHSLCIFGMRPVRDYKVLSGGRERLGSSSPFNIAKVVIGVGYFSRTDVELLYGQHTAETGQAFTSAAIDLVMELSGGQPYLVNALADELVLHLQYKGTIDAEHIEIAKERLILTWPAHFEGLMERLREDRVRRVIEPMLAGDSTAQLPTEDLRYVRDLGLVTGPGGDVANAIYREVIPRCLADIHAVRILKPPGRWTRPDGALDIDGLRSSFLEFWAEHAEQFALQETYTEVSPHLIFFGYLQRLVNGGGHVLREYGAGRKRIDVLVKWPRPGQPGQFEQHLFELKVWHRDKADPKPEGLLQVGEYLERVACDSASLLIFDRRPGAMRRRWAKRCKPEAERPVVAGLGVWVCRL